MVVVVQDALGSPDVKKRRLHLCAAAFGTRQIPTLLLFPALPPTSTHQEEATAHSTTVGVPRCGERTMHTLGARRSIKHLRSAAERERNALSRTVGTPELEERMRVTIQTMPNAVFLFEHIVEPTHAKSGCFDFFLVTKKLTLQRHRWCFVLPTADSMGFRPERPVTTHKARNTPDSQ